VLNYYLIFGPLNLTVLLHSPRIVIMLLLENFDFLVNSYCNRHIRIYKVDALFLIHSHQHLNT